MSRFKIGTMKKDGLDGLSSFRLGKPKPGAAERAREIKTRQKERGIVFPDSTDLVRADRDAR